jgi:hypothetical protein
MPEPMRGSHSGVYPAEANRNSGKQTTCPIQKKSFTSQKCNPSIPVVPMNCGASVQKTGLPGPVKNCQLREPFTELCCGKDGSLADIKIERGIGGGCDEAVIRVLK